MKALLIITLFTSACASLETPITREPASEHQLMQIDDVYASDCQITRYPDGIISTVICKPVIINQEK